MTTPRAKPRQETPAVPDPVTPEPNGPIVLRLPPEWKLTEDQFLELCGLNDTLRIEINARGELELMAPTFNNTSNKNIRISARLQIWAETDDSGLAFESNAGFTLPNGALRSPDASWVLKSRLVEIPEPERLKFSPICPDFVVELRSESDRLRDIQAKMEEYLANGARLGWLIDPLDPRHRVYIYRPGVTVEVVEAPETLSGDPELPGFVLEMQRIWEPSL
ncbi:MAG: Uma2 family endonuclease [Chloroflexi bacterium]|nr:Uma2 family endonuclease [Chloroflexota bacterium]